MVSEPNFVLDIKQTSLANKEDSHVHTAIRSHTCLSAGSRLHSISQLPWLTAVSRSSSPSNPCLSLSNRCTTSLRLMKPTRQTCSMAYHDQNLRTWPPTAAARAITHGQRLLELSHVLPQILDSQLGSHSYVPPRRPCRPPIYLAWESGGWLLLHVPPRATWVSDFSSTRWWTRTLLTCAENCYWCHLTSSDDVITPRQQPCKDLYIRPSPRQQHIIGWRQQLYCSTRDQLGNPEPTRTSIRWLWPWTVDFDFLRWPLTKSQNFRKGPSCSVFWVDSNFRLRSSFEALKLVN